MEKQNLAQQKHAFTNQNKCTTTQNKHQKLKPGLVASYNIWPGNGESLFLVQHLINLSLAYLDTYALTFSSRPTRGNHDMKYEHQSGVSVCLYIH